MVEAREQGVFNLDDRDESRVKKKDKTQIHSIYIFDPRSYFHLFRVFIKFCPR